MLSIQKAPFAVWPDWKNRRPVLQRHAIQLCLSLGRQPHLIANGGRPQIDRRRPDSRIVRRRSRRRQQRRQIVKRPHHPVPFVFHRRDHPVGIAAHIPPLIATDAVAVRIGACPNRGMARSRLRIGIVVITGAEVSAPLEKQVEAVRCLQRVAIAVEIVAAELIDDQNHDQLWLRMVRIRACGGRSGQQKKR